METEVIKPERRRKRVRGGSKPEGEEPLAVKEEEPIIKERAEKKSQLVMRKDLDEIKAELVEERSSGLVESGYWDETHSWGSDEEEASSEYWHFLGRYE